MYCWFWRNWNIDVNLLQTLFIEFLPLIDLDSKHYHCYAVLHTNEQRFTSAVCGIWNDWELVYSSAVMAGIMPSPQPKSPFMSLWVISRWQLDRKQEKSIEILSLHTAPCFLSDPTVLYQCFSFLIYLSSQTSGCIHCCIYYSMHGLEPAVLGTARRHLNYTTKFCRFILLRQ